MRFQYDLELEKMAEHKLTPKDVKFLEGVLKLRPRRTESYLKRSRLPPPLKRIRSDVTQEDVDADWRFTIPSVKYTIEEIKKFWRWGRGPELSEYIRLLIDK